MDIEIAAKQLSELGHPTRLSIFRYLTRGGGEDIPVGKIQQALGIPASTLSHHITRLISVGLVIQRREGRTLYCVPQIDKLDNLILFLKQECCLDKCS